MRTVHTVVGVRHEDDPATETVLQITRGAQAGLTPEGDLVVSDHDHEGLVHQTVLEFDSEEVAHDVLLTMLAAWGNRLAADAARAVRRAS